MRGFQLIPYNTKIDIVGKRFFSFTLSMILVIATVGGFMTKGLNYGIDFKGGLLLEVRTPQPADLPKMRADVDELGLGEVALQEFGSNQDILIKVERQPGGEEAQLKAIEKLKATLGTSVEYRRVETVGPKVGAELINNSLQAIGFSLLAMLIYIWFRFEWQFGACAVIALTHDCIGILGLFTFFPLEFNETAIIAVLITAVYSINDTVVIYDRIRENLRKYKKMDLKDLINLSLNETLSRTVLTATTTLLALFALYFFGGKVISSFSLPIICGIAIGMYSSVALASPLLLYLNIRRDKDEKEEGPPAIVVNR